MTPDCRGTGKAGAACKDTSRDAVLFCNNSPAPQVFAMTDASINLVGDDSAPNHRPVNKPLVTAIAARIKKLGAEHMHIPEGAVATAEGSSSSASSNDSIARGSHPDSIQPASTAARPGRHNSPSTCWPPSIGRTAPHSSILTSMTQDCKGTGKAGAG